MDASELKNQVDIIDFIEQFCELKKKRDGEYWGLSPLKEERTPSFSVNWEKQVYYDFSSGSSGDILDFIRAYYHCDFAQAVRILEKYAGIQVGETRPEMKRMQSSSVAKKFQKKEEMKEIHRTELREDCMDRFEWNPEKLAVWKAEGIPEAVLWEYGVRYDPSANRLVFPVRDNFGRIVNICGRTLNKDYKARQIRKYTYYEGFGGGLDLIYGLFEHRQAILSHREIILFEGAKSVMLASGWGISNTGALLTSHLNQYQFCLLLQLRANVVFALDKDVDIHKDKTIRKLPKYTKVSYIYDTENLLDEKMSPVDAGKEVWDRLYRNRLILR